MLQDDLFEEHDAEHAFGALLTTLRSRARGKKVKQKDIVAGLPGWPAGYVLRSFVSRLQAATHRNQPPGRTRRVAQRTSGSIDRAAEQKTGCSMWSCRDG